MPTLAHRLFAQSIRDMRAMPADTVETAAQALLSRLLAHAARNVPFYDALATRPAADAEPDAVLASLPVIVPEAASDPSGRFVARELPPQDAPLDDPSWTTLSTPTAGPYGVLADIADRGQWEYLARTFEIDTSGRLAVILPRAVCRPGDLADPTGPWSLDAHAGLAHRWSEEFDAAATLVWLANVEPACLFLRPAALEALLDAPTRHRPAVADIVLAGPALRSDTKARCEERFGARLVEAITCEGGGFVAGAEPDGSFVPALETAIVEILDEGGRATGPGEPGRLVATALYGYRRVVIRHDLGLVAAWSDERSRCGRRCFRVLANG